MAATESEGMTLVKPKGDQGRQTAPVPMMLLALTTPSATPSTLPLRARALPQAELLHRALVARAGRGGRVDCPELTGRDDQNRPLTGHRHAHVLPLDLDGDGHLDHVLVWAPMGLGAVAQRAVRSLKETWTKGGEGALRVALAGEGALDRLHDLPPHLAAGVEALLGPPGGARVWTSATPFVPPRFVKPRGANTLAGQVAAELASRGLSDAAVEVLPWDDRTRDLRHSVRVRRDRGKPPPVDAGFALRLVFGEPVAGPLALGYAAHFGLGLFLAVEVGGRTRPLPAGATFRVIYPA
jgi:CRISPR-associated protein Csb2